MKKESLLSFGETAHSLILTCCYATIHGQPYIESMLRKIAEIGHEVLGATHGLIALTMSEYKLSVVFNGRSVWVFDSRQLQEQGTLFSLRPGIEVNARQAYLSRPIGHDHETTKATGIAGLVELFKYRERREEFSTQETKLLELICAMIDFFFVEQRNCSQNDRAANLVELPADFTTGAVP